MMNRPLTLTDFAPLTKPGEVLIGDQILTPKMAAYDRRRAMEKTDPLLALAYFVEAALSGKTENDVCGLSRDADILERSRALLVKVTGSVENVLFQATT